MKFKILMAVICSAFVMSAGDAHAQFGGFLKEKLKKAAVEEAMGAVDLDVLKEQQGGLIGQYHNSLQNKLAGQKHLALSLGMGEEAEKADQQLNILRGGIVEDKNLLNEAGEVSEELDQKLEKQLKKTKDFDDASKAEFALATPFYAQSTASAAKLGPEFATWLKGALYAVNSNGLAGGAAIAGSLDNGIFVGRKMPDYVKSSKKNFKNIEKAAKKHKVEVPEIDV